MPDFQKALQLYIGSKERKSFSKAEIKRRIQRAKEIAGVDSLMIWTDGDLRLYEELIAVCRECGIAPYLWFAVLADVQGAAIAGNDLMQNYDGRRGYGKIGAWKDLGSGGESFLFYCPNCDGPVESVLRAYACLLDRLDFAGVMLDRIRFPSPVNGFESLFGCFCDACGERFFRIYGQPLNQQREAAASLLTRLGRISAREAHEWGSFDALWQAAGLEPLFDFKRRSIARIVERFSVEARVRSLQVGLDLYSYSLAPLVAQDYDLLSRTGDWIKPMIYCRAVGPAGLPLELACLQEAFQTLCPRLQKAEVKELLMGLLGWDWPDSADELLRVGLNEQIISIELQRIAAGKRSVGARVLAGIEAVRNPDFGINITEEKLRRTLARAAQASDGIIASWNLLYIPDENLEIIAACRRERLVP
jgi:hypothetical protein